MHTLFILRIAGWEPFYRSFSLDKVRAMADEARDIKLPFYVTVSQ